MFRFSAPATLGLLALGSVASGCLLAYDFEEYGSGGNGPSSSSSGGAGGGVDFEPCVHDGATFIVLPETWTDVRVTQIGSTFVAAPKDLVEYVEVPVPLPSEFQPTPQLRDDIIRGLRGLFRLSLAEDDERLLGLFGDSEDLKLRLLTGGVESSRSIRADFASARQFFGEIATLLVTEEANLFGVESVQARVLAPVWNGQAPDYFRLLDELVPLESDPACLPGSCAFRSATGGRNDDTGEYYVAYLGQGLTDEAVVGGTPIGKNAFLTFAGLLDEVGPEPFNETNSLEGILDEGFEVGPLLVKFSGIRNGRNARVALFEATVGDVEIVGEGLASRDHPSRFAKQHWMITQFIDEVADVAVYEIEAEVGADPLFHVPGVTGFDVTSVSRTVEQVVALLISVEVPEVGDVQLGDCRLPAGRSVLVQRDVAAP